MITTIWKYSKKQRLRRLFSNGYDTYTPSISPEMVEEIDLATYYPAIEELPDSIIQLSENMSLTGRIKYSRGTDNIGTKNKNVDIFVELGWVDTPDS